MSLSQLSQLLPLPEEELQQVLDYATTLSKPEAVSHFSNLLGDSPLAVDFISSFNSRRKDPSAAPAPSPAPGPSSSTEPLAPVPKTKRGGNQNKKKKAIHTPPPRQINDYSNAAGGGTAYSKKDNDLDYIPQHQRASAPTSQHVSRAGTPTNKPAAAPAPQKEKEQRPSSGYLISDLPASKAKSNPTSRTSTPKPPRRRAGRYDQDLHFRRDTHGGAVHGTRGPGRSHSCARDNDESVAQRRSEAQTMQLRGNASPAPDGGAKLHLVR